MVSRLALIALLILLTSCAAYKPDAYLPVNSTDTPPDALYGRYLGTSNLYFSDGSDAVMIDAYFSRQSVFDTFVKNIQSDESYVRKSFKSAKITQLNRLLVSHSHFDHVLDVDSVSKIFPDVVVHGSAQTGKLFSGVKFIDVNETISQGAFTISAIESPHVKKTRRQQWFERLLNKWAGGEQYAESGTVFSFHIAHPQVNILIISSAAYPETFNGLQADVVFMGIGLLSNWLGKPGIYGEGQSYIEQYWQTAVIDTCAKSVIPVHWDNLFSPIKEKMQVTYSKVDNIEGTMAVLTALANTTKGCNGQPVKIRFPRGYKRFNLPVE